MAMKTTFISKADSNSKQQIQLRVLTNPEGLKKDLENERRLARLKQVREKSKNLARTIRQEVAAEKKRQIQTLENKKQQELNTWREHVMAKKYQDYRTSMFQVGAAHRAAQHETENNEKQKQLREQKIKNCQRLAIKNATKPMPTTRLTGGKDRNEKVFVAASTKTKTPAQSEKTNHGKENRLCNKHSCKPTNNSSHKCKRCKYCPNNPNEQEENKDEKTLKIILDSSSSSSDEETAETPKTSRADSGKKLDKTPPIVLTVDDESEDSLEICSQNGIEIKDRHMQTNRQFCRVVRPTNTKSPELPQEVAVEEIPSRPRFTQVSDLVLRNKRVAPSTDKQQQEQESHTPRSPTKSPPRSPRSPSKTTTTTTAARTRASSDSPIKISTRSTTPKRAPQIQSTVNRGQQIPAAKVIDAGLKSSLATGPTKATKQKPHIQQTAAEPTRMQPRHQQEPTPIQQLPMQETPREQQPMQPLHPYMHPVMQPHVMYAPQIMQPYPMLPYPMQPYTMPPISQFATQPVPTTQQQQQNIRPFSTTTTAPVGAPPRTTSSHTAVSTTTFPGQVTSANNKNGHVQFYDHNNKYQRNYKAPTEAVHANLQDNTNLNAMEQARIETNMRKLREQELESRRQVTEQRGQKALQREQVRRDCAELTEKLDALTQQQPQLLPSDANFVSSHHFADLALRREQKMNAAMEEMLLRPAIVTCPEVKLNRNLSPKKSGTRCKTITPEAINLGNPPTEMADTVSSCSQLLDFVDDQSNQLRTELKGMQSNCSKSVKLRSLLQRIEKIRARLLAELQAGDLDGNYAQQVIDSIRNERANLQTATVQNIDQREMELQQKEELLEQRLRQLYKQHQKVNGRKQHSSDNPVEIIIKVKSDGTVKQYVPKSKLQDKQKPKAMTEQGDTQPTITSSAANAEEAPNAAPSNQRQHSIDSTSTVYRELPPVNYENIKPITATAAPNSAEEKPLDPMVAHYVHRLLAMSRNSVEKLSASSSEVLTPSESIINQPSNVTNGGALDIRHVEQVQEFIRQNRSFVEELEDTLRSQEQQKQQQQQQQQQQNQQQQKQQQQKKQQLPAEESSRRVFDQIWNQRLAKRKQQQQSQSRRQEHQPEIERPTYSAKANASRRSVSTATAKETARSVSYQLPQEATTKTRSTQMHRQQRITETISRDEDSNGNHEKCRQRITTLEALINKVRREKQKLVEVTLTSASEGERHSTEYFDLPPGQTQQQLQQPSSQTISERSDSHNTTPSHSEALPLQKHKPTGASLDSGISISRPLTAMGQEPLEAEPTSLGSSTQSGATQRRAKVPPATIRRYSPQLAAEELAHELSTITEVDTPAQSHMMATTPAPVPFPSFEQYAQELQLDFTRMDSNQSMRMQQEFHELIKIIKQCGSAVDYREFPSITAYLHNITTTTTRVHVESNLEQPSQTAAEMRLPNVSIREFPNRREFIKQLLAREPPEQRDLIDSTSLDSSDSFNVEAELRQRRILRSFFRRGPEAELEVASSTRRESIPLDNSAYAPNESDIEPLTQLDRQRMRVPRPVNMRQQERHVQQSNGILGFESTPNDRSAGGSVHMSKDELQDVSDMVGTLNLRDFLTVELTKQRQKALGNGNSSSGSSDSLKGNFLQSVIDSLSPASSQHTPALAHATNGTNDRQKTSTPVGSLLSDQDRCSSVHSGSMQLFSHESSLSAVNNADGTPPVPYERQTMSLGRSPRTPTEHRNRKPRKL